MISDKSKTKQKEETERRTRMGGVERESVLIIQHYPCSLFMALLRKPAEAIYAHAICAGCSLKVQLTREVSP